MDAPGLTALLSLRTTLESEWRGTLWIVPVAAPDDPVPDLPGKKVGEFLTIPASQGTRRMLFSAGVQGKLNAERIRRAGRVAGRWLVEHHADAAALNLSDFAALDVEGGLDAFCEGLLLGAFRFRRYKSKTDELAPVTVHVLTSQPDEELEKRIERVEKVVTAANAARALAHEPPNSINPMTLGERARALADETGLVCKVLGEKELSAMGANAILSVGLGSKTPSQMIIFEYPGQGEQQGTAPVVILGKAITFDTGGYSLKNTKGIVGMKYDKCGGAAVFGIMQAVAAMKLPVPVVGIVAAAENKISPDAYLPNDVITTLSGKTVEIVSTDAEGRMVLCDALTYAQQNYQPRAMIDLATLTGGIVVSLGSVRAGLFSNNDKLAADLLASGERTHELLWRMPLDDEYFVLIKGDDADIRNSSQIRKAHPVVGGIFLKQFVADEIPWAHLDIAGMAYIETELVPYKPTGATGFGVRLVMDYLSQLG